MKLTIKQVFCYGQSYWQRFCIWFVMPAGRRQMVKQLI